MSFTKKVTVPTGSTVPIFSHNLIYGRAVRFWVDIIAIDGTALGFELIVHQGKTEISHSLVTEIGDPLNYQVDIIVISGQNINISLTNIHTASVETYTRILNDEMVNVRGFV